MPPSSSPRVKLRAATRRVPRARSAGKTTDDVPPEYEPEPNMKLSRALAVVLLLHVVAIGGIIGFSLIKDHNPDHLTAGGETTPNVEAEDAHLPSAPGRDAADGAPRPAIHVVRQGETLTRIANANGVSLEALLAANGSAAVGGIRPGQQLRLPEKVSAPSAASNPAGTPAATVSDDADTAALNLTPPNAANKGTHPGPAASPTAAGAEGAQTYTVGKGESPYTIAHKFKINLDALLKLNGIDDPKKIKPGQKLRIPPSRPAAKPEGKAKLKA